MAAAGVGSRRHCETLIATGRVTVNGEVVTELGTRVDPSNVEIYVDGRRIGPSQDKIYILLNKPRGYTSTRSDPHAAMTVLDLIPEIKDYVYPVGRLDVDTSGLLILTNDGDLTRLLTHPSHEVEKTYRAVARGRISRESLTRLERGIILDDGLTAPAKARLISYNRQEDVSIVDITIHEGRNRQVRRMFDAVGYRVVELSRKRIGDLSIADLPEGRHRILTALEVNRLKDLAAVKNQKK